jgi:hypothetical protein
MLFKLELIEHLRLEVNESDALPNYTVPPRTVKLRAHDPVLFFISSFNFFEQQKASLM